MGFIVWPCLILVPVWASVLPFPCPSVGSTFHSTTLLLPPDPCKIWPSAELRFLNLYVFVCSHIKRSAVKILPLIRTKLVVLKSDQISTWNLVFIHTHRYRNVNTEVCTCLVNTYIYISKMLTLGGCWGGDMWEISTLFLQLSCKSKIISK